MKGDEESRRLAQAALGAVADDGAADAAGGGETEADERGLVGAMADLGGNRAHGAGLALGRQQEDQTFV